jgi:hypothetical protein
MRRQPETESKTSASVKKTMQLAKSRCLQKELCGSFIRYPDNPALQQAILKRDMPVAAQ